MKHPCDDMLSPCIQVITYTSITLIYNNYLAPHHLAPKGLVAQLVEHHTGVVEVWVRFPPKSWNFLKKFQDLYTSVIGLIYCTRTYTMYIGHG